VDIEQGRARLDSIGFVCFSYIGDDKEIPFSIEVGEGSESSDEESSADGNSDVEMEG
jgi:hypothetical protein